MERTKHANNEMQTNAQQLIERLEVLQSISTRMGLARQMMTQTFGGDRNLISTLGYPDVITFQDYYSRYCYQDIAKAVIDKPVDRTWKGDILIEESKDDQETALEKAWIELNDRLKLKSVLCRLDKLTGIGEYGVLLLGFSDTTSLEVYATPVNKSKELKLNYVKPFSQGSATIATWESEPTSNRFGLPLLYNITFKESGTGNSKTISVHYSRLLHIVDDILESEIEGHPRMQSIFYRLIDLEKILGGDGEMFWRGARPGYVNTVDKEFNVTPDQLKKLQTQVDEYEMNLRRFLTVQGMDIKSLQQQLADPASHVDIQIQMISAKTGIPKRVLMGSERGELSSGQDADEWNTLIQTRREEYAELRILKPLIDKLIELGILPPADTGKYSIRWEDLFNLSPLQKTEIGKNRATALKDYSTNPEATSIIPAKAFMTYFLGLDDEEVEIITQMSEAEVNEEPALSEEEMQTIKQAGEVENNVE